MDKRYKSLPLPQQLVFRKKAIDDVLANPQWSLAQTVRHLKKSMRLTTAEFAKLAGFTYRAGQDIERGQSSSTIQSPNRILWVLGLKLGVTRVDQLSDFNSSHAAETDPQETLPGA